MATPGTETHPGSVIEPTGVTPDVLWIGLLAIGDGQLAHIHFMNQIIR
jgi:hypothetical protein